MYWLLAYWSWNLFPQTHVLLSLRFQRHFIVLWRRMNWLDLMWCHKKWITSLCKMDLLCLLRILLNSELEREDWDRVEERGSVHLRSTPCRPHDSSAAYGTITLGQVVRHKLLPLEVHFSSCLPYKYHAEIHVDTVLSGGTGDMS